MYLFINYLIFILFSNCILFTHVIYPCVVVMFENLLKFGAYRKVSQSYNFLTLKLCNFSVLCNNSARNHGILNSCATTFSESSPNYPSNLNNNLPNSNDIKRNLFNYFQSRGPKIVKPKDVIHFWKIRPGDKVILTNCSFIHC